VLVLERAVGSLRALPRISQVGIVTLLLGFAIDLVAHVSWSDGQTAGHLVTLAGMGLALTGALGTAFRGPSGPRGRRNG